MYCINCGVKLADTEKKCPLCHTVVFHPNIPPKNVPPLYPADKLPKAGSGKKALCGAMIILFLLPIVICFFADILYNKTLDWFGYVLGALLVFYTAFALPLWFNKPNPVIFTPCTFAAAALYLLYIQIATHGNWFLRFAFPVTGGLCILTCAVVTLLHYLHKGKLYIIGGACMLFGAFTMLIEFLLSHTFGLKLVGWSVYPFVALLLIGGLFLYFAINASARETMERKLFF